MNILVNASNLKKGGGIQVALSILGEFSRINSAVFLVVVSDSVYNQLNINEFGRNFKFIRYNIKPNVFKALSGYDRFLSNLESEFKPKWVFSIFGPSYWIPKVNHLVGYAVPHYLYRESPFFDIIPFKERIHIMLLRILSQLNLSKGNTFFWVETSDVQIRLAKFLSINVNRIKVISNTCHSVFLNELPNSNIKYDHYFDNDSSIKLITISANYLHKNLGIINNIVPLLKERGIALKFYLTLEKSEFEKLYFDKHYVVNLGPVDIIDCPYLYSKSDFLFLPTLLECFSASYVEAMKMGVPILTSNLSFAVDVCGDAAEYFHPLDVIDIVNKIELLIHNDLRKNELILNGKNRLMQFETANNRALRIFNSFQN